MIIKQFYVEGSGILGKLNGEDNILLTINPKECGDMVRTDLVAAFDELIAYHEFINQKPQRAAGSNGIVVQLEQASDQIREGAFKGETLQSVYNREGKRAIEHLLNSTDEHTRKIAEHFLREVANAV